MKLEYPYENNFPSLDGLGLGLTITYTNGYDSKDYYQLTINSAQNNGRQYTLKKKNYSKEQPLT